VQLQHAPPKEVQRMDAEEYFQSDIVVDATGRPDKTNISDRKTIAGIFKGMLEHDIIDPQEVDANVEKYIAGHGCKTDFTHEEKPVFITPGFQMKKLGLEEDREIITQIFERARTSGKDEPYQIKMAVPYQQIPKWFKELLSDKNNNKVELLTCSLEANGYFLSLGIKKHFPYLYRWTTGELLLKNDKHKNDFTVHEFKREFTRRIPKGV